MKIHCLYMLSRLCQAEFATEPITVYILPYNGQRNRMISDSMQASHCAKNLKIPSFPLGHICLPV